MAGHGPPHDTKTDESDFRHWARSSMSSKSSGDAGASEPAEPLERGGLGLVLAADPSVVAELVDTAEQEVIIDFAGPGLVTAGIVGNLNMRDAIEMLRDRRRKFAFCALH